MQAVFICSEYFVSAFVIFDIYAEAINMRLMFDNLFILRTKIFKLF